MSTSFSPTHVSKPLNASISSISSSTTTPPSPSTSIFIPISFNFAASFVENHCDEPKILAKLFNLMLKVYSDSQKFEEALETFNYMRNNGVKINETTCTIHLIALVRCDQVGSALEFLCRMVESGIEVSVFSMIVVVDGLCTSGEIRRGRELVEEMMGGGVKPNSITFSTLVDACAKRWNFGELDLILILMKRE
ncbi:hypothetical protein ACSBR1_033658 [Camellia fascicularis]